MPQNNGLFDLDITSNPTISQLMESQKQKIAISNALKVINQQMRVNGYREITITDYNYVLNKFAEDVNIQYLHEITTQKIYEWLNSMTTVTDVTKYNRLKYIKAVLGRCYDNGWYETKFWKTIKIRVNKKVKKGATRNDIAILLSLLDTSTFIGARDYIAITVLYKTGIRINTLGLLEERHIDFANKALNCTGDIMKNHNSLILPIDDKLCELLQFLIKENNKIRREMKQNNEFIFITRKGTSVNGKASSNSIAKQLYKYSKRYGLENINAHAIRRAYAKNLLDKGANIALISKALGHSDLKVTTQYLSLDEKEVATNLREFL